MQHVYGVATRKGGQGKSTTVAMLARLCGLAGARVLVVDLAQPGTATASLRNIWPAAEHGNLARVLLSFQGLGAGQRPAAADARAALASVGLPVRLHALPSWSGGYVGVLPWDELVADAAGYLQSERVLSGVLDAIARDFDLALIDYPAEGGPLMTNALAATERVIVPVVAETPALEGLESMLRLLARVREAGHAISLAAILLTRCDPKNRRVREVVQTILQAGEVEGEAIGRKLLPFAIRQHEFYEQSFRYGEPVWERTGDPSQWAGYVLLAEWLLRDAGLGHLTETRKGPAILPPETRVLGVEALRLDDGEVRVAELETARLATRAMPRP